MYSQNMALVDYSDGDSEDDLIIPPPNVNDGNNVVCRTIFLMIYFSGTC